jgi:hypothetical protein
MKRLKTIVIIAIEIVIDVISEKRKKIEKRTSMIDIFLRFMGR